jgi:predicted amino acid dehydrogenase
MHAHYLDVVVSPSLNVRTTRRQHVGICNTRAQNKEPRMMLKNKVAVIYGAGGGIGGAVARAFAREGAKLFLTGRRSKLSPRKSTPLEDPPRRRRSTRSTSGPLISIYSP